MQIGVISDTHGYLHPKVFDAFNGVDHILHAGDIGNEAILTELRAIAPVTAVLGNGDYFRGYQKYARIEVVNFDLINILLTHQYPAYGETSQEIENRIRLCSPQIIVSGHTHTPVHQQEKETLYFNPGSAGNTLYYADKSVGLLTIHPHTNGAYSVNAEIIKLEVF